MKAIELRKKTATDLKKLLVEDQGKLRQLRFDLVGGKVKNVREIRKIRKEIARILTVTGAKK
jgi:large subunit ribosomal protein L29